ncbi:hypothetical protein G7Z17_g4740 [Cylindrodendrum hubeiense]|uniref:Uncharacterized protein n=1 Tax=Cylindrodendrum hubeiense TaxID=595255 RepID=A0A9P5LI13_9HYPO|nr:hypothetical protein G7Z17_g4740 [Cylindrodendrum hubeiense]
MRLLTRWLFTGASAEETFTRTSAKEIGTPLCIAYERIQIYEESKAILDHSLRYAVQIWLEDLMEAGVDLEAYGQLEAAALSRNTEDFNRRFMGETWVPGFCLGPYLVSLEYGPRPEDWKVGYDHCVEEYAGEFWWVLGAEERLMPGPMPGAWEDEDE